MAVLLFHPFGEYREYYTLEKQESRVGRDESSDIVLNDDTVSRHHARIVLSDQGYLVKDLDSKNGTRVNGSLIREAHLHQGDRIHFGDVRARFFESPTDELPFDEGLDTGTLLVPWEDIGESSTRLRFLYELAEAAASAEDEKDVISKGLEILGGQLDCENTYIGLYYEALGNIGKGFFRSFADDSQGRFALSRTILSRTIESRAGVILEDVREESFLQDAESVLASGMRSALCTPMIVAGDLVGVLYADTRSRVRRFTNDDLAFATALGSMLGSILRTLASISELERKNRELHIALEGLDLVGESPGMVLVREILHRYASKGDAPVLIMGESGTGKELAARMIHRFSRRADMPFLEVNCAAIPEALMESELFGHVKGAFTSAGRDRKGLFALADRGTLFLDEIAEMTPALQAKLLRVLEAGEMRPVGSDRSIKVDVRIVAATNRELSERISKGGFREDLFYRLHVLSVEMPPLRTHKEDLRALAEHFLNSIRCRVSTPAVGFSSEAIEKLDGHGWPGNVRELKNVIERALYVCDGREILPEYLIGLGEDDSVAEKQEGQEKMPQADRGPLDRQIEDLERVRIAEALEHNRWNRSKAAEELGISRKTLQGKIKKYGL